MRLTKAFLMLTMMLLITLAAGAPDEAMGRVSKVVDGDTFDVTLESHDSRISEDLIRIRLADIDTPEVRGPKVHQLQAPDCWSLLQLFSALLNAKHRQ